MAIASAQPKVLADVIPHTWARQLVLVAGAAAFVGLSAQVAFYLPWNPAVPITLQTFAVVLSAAALYALLGGLGVPWFAEHKSGFGGPAFGYIIGFIVAAWVVGKVADMGATRTVLRTAGLMILGNVIIYAVGVTWLKYSLSLPWFGAQSAFAFGVKDFVIGDLIKIAFAAGLLPATWALLRKLKLSD